MTNPQPLESALVTEHTADDTGEPATARVRLDKWLWAARFFKTRSLAAAAVDAGRVDVNGERAKRARHVQIGDTVSVRRPPFEHHVAVRGVAEVRGPASAAARLYEETAESRRAREVLAFQLKNAPVLTFHGGGRPTKRDRRAIERLKRKRSGE
jgi:ribosome-associated heat shock protein Hsp15